MCVLNFIFVAYVINADIDKQISQSDFLILSFNVQNLFDGIDDNQEHSGYAPPQWTNNDYENRLVSIGKALQGLAFSPDIIALQEIEHEQVVKDLQKYYLPQFIHVVVTDNKNSATENAILSKYNIREVHMHTIHESFYKGNRYLLDVTLELPKSVPQENRILQVIVVHLKSRIATRTTHITSDEIRKKQYILIKKIEKKDIPTIILGDFNDDNAVQSLLEDEESFSFIEYPLLSYHPDIDGTYYYKKSWVQLDHIILDYKANAMFELRFVSVLDYYPFLHNFNIPNRFIKHKKNFDAVSDHLPILFGAVFIY